MAGVKGKSGPRRKPTKLRILEGNRSRSSIPEEVEPSEIAAKPKRFKTQLERKAWDKLTPPLFDMGLATAADQEQLERLCYWWAEHIYYAYKPNYDFGRSERAYRMFERIASQFGMTPSTRAGLQATGGKKQLDEIEAMLA